MAKSKIVEADKLAPYEPTSSIYLSKEDAAGLSIGENVSLSISGEVIGINKDYGDSKKYRVEIKKAKVTGVDANEADREYRKMTEE